MGFCAQTCPFARVTREVSRHRRCYRRMDTTGAARKGGIIPGLSLGCEGHEGIPQCFGLLGHRRDLAFTVLRFIRVEALLDISATVLQQAIDETSQFVRCRRDGLWGAKARFHPPKKYRKFKRPFPLAACTHPVPVP